MSRSPTVWNELPRPLRAVVVTVGVVDAGLRVWALADLRTRPADRVNGPKVLWGLALGLVSSAGILPTAYAIVGRRTGRG